MFDINKNKDIVNFIKSIYPSLAHVPLHAPVFNGNEKKYIIEAIDSTYVSSVGPFVNRFEEMISEITGARYAVAAVNGTASLHLALVVAEVETNDEVLTQSLTFIATCNAISYLKAHPVFIDIDKDTLSMSPDTLIKFLEERCIIKHDGYTYNKNTGRRIKACVPMHSFGLPGRILEIVKICKAYNIVLIEDAAESIGSLFQNKSTGTFGDLGVFSFNGNKIVTCGGGGAIITDNEELAKKAKHLSTQAKIPHSWNFNHDAIGYNYRLPNLNAAIACAQLENLELFINNKRHISEKYKEFFKDRNEFYIEEIEGARSNYWLNSVLFSDEHERDIFLKYSNDNSVMTRPVWQPMHLLEMFRKSDATKMDNTNWISERLVNLPSSVST
uniref:LegC family aminotransferase n=1 Tax=Algoriphagus sp. TaxID=1872435 RepID=UPI0040476895